ncbi:hypothetical protein Bbelb_088090 [Branchiostoma belcheri]|nr:hypothetical protein Bbelb_088090 [Branchiostoma belcheri]
MGILPLKNDDLWDRTAHLHFTFNGSLKGTMTAPPSRPYLMCTPPPQPAAAGTDHGLCGYHSVPPGALKTTFPFLFTPGWSEEGRVKCLSQGHNVGAHVQTCPAMTGCQAIYHYDIRRQYAARSMESDYIQTVADLAEHQPTTANLADDLLLTMVSGDDAVFYIRDVSQDHAVFPDELILVVNQCRCPA